MIFREAESCKYFLLKIYNLNNWELVQFLYLYFNLIVFLYSNLNLNEVIALVGGSTQRYRLYATGKRLDGSNETHTDTTAPSSCATYCRLNGACLSFSFASDITTCWLHDIMPADGVEEVAANFNIYAEENWIETEIMQ